MALAFLLVVSGKVEAVALPLVEATTNQFFNVPTSAITVNSLSFALNIRAESPTMPTVTYKLDGAVPTSCLNLLPVSINVGPHSAPYYVGVKQIYLGTYGQHKVHLCGKDVAGNYGPVRTVIINAIPSPLKALNTSKY